jgi:hypothetical protein
MLVSELKGDDLAYWAAKAQGWTEKRNGWLDKSGEWHDKHFWAPHLNWHQCGGLIEKYSISITPCTDGWYAECGVSHADAYGDTPQEAVCRAVVADMFGEEVGDGV